MSFDIYLMTPPGPAFLFERAVVERAFAAVATNQETDYWDFRPPDGPSSLAELHIAAGPMIDGFSVNRPPGETFVEFWDAMFEVMRTTETFLVWPAPGPGPSYCVARDDWMSYMLAAKLDHMGDPAVVSSGLEIPRLIKASGV